MRSTLILTALAATLSLATGANAATLIDLAPPTGQEAFSSIGTGRSVHVDPLDDTAVFSLGVYADINSNTSGTFEMAIYQVGLGDPIAVSESLVFASPANLPEGWLDFQFDDAVSLSSVNNYRFVLRPVAGSSIILSVQTFADSPPSLAVTPQYTAGGLFTVIGKGDDSDGASTNFLLPHFRVLVPEPASVAFGAVAIALILSRRQG